jgi:outer membrane protein assembly factor BamB
MPFKSCFTAVVFVMSLGISDSRSQANDIWPGFRGTGDSQSAAKDLPVTWELRGRSRGSWNIRLPGYGQSSPVVWKDRVFVTSVSGDHKEHLHVLAFSLADGEKLWQRDFVGTQKIKDSDMVSRGAPTPVADADRVYVMFESGDLFALTHAGDPVWNRSLVKDYGEFQGPHGYASSPVLADDLVIVQVCHGGPSYLLAVDRTTGQNVWKTEHPSQTGWSSPAVYRHNGVTGIIVSTAGSVRGFNAADGRELWFVTGINGNSTASPTVVGDLVVIGSSGERGGGDSGRGPRRGSLETSDTREGNQTLTSPATTGSGTKTASDVKPEAPRGEGSRPGLTPPDPATLFSAAIRLGGSGDVSASHVVWKNNKVTAGYASPLVHNGIAYFVSRIGVAQGVNVKTGEVLFQQRLPGQVWASPIANGEHVFFFCKEGQVLALKSGPIWDEVGESSVSATDIIYGVAAIDGAWLIRTGRGLIKLTTAP